MAEISEEELEQKILKYLGTVTEIKPGAVAKAVGGDPMRVKKLLGKMSEEGKVEFTYKGTSFVKLAGK